VSNVLNLLAPWGFYGSGNIGDEATLMGFARLVTLSRRPFRVWVGSRNPRHTARVEPSFRYFRHPFGPLTRRWANYRTCATVMPGGTPIMDCHGPWPLDEVVPILEAAHRRGRPIVFVGAGTERLQREESRRILAERLAPIVHFWTVRSETDEARLIQYGVPPECVRVAGDMAWLLEPVSADWGKERLRAWGASTARQLVGVNLMDEKPVREQHPDHLRTMARSLDRLIESRDVTILFLANDINDTVGFDRPAMLQTLAAMEHRDRAFMAPTIYWSPPEMMSLIANCHATISMRYHFCLFSALQGVPFIALQRSDKVADLCTDLQWSFGTPLDGLSVQALDQLFEAVERERTAAIGRLHTRTPALRERASLNVAALEALAS